MILMFSGCLSSTAYITYDDATPPEQKCTLTIAASLTVTEFNGKAVEWKPAFGYNWGEVQIPQGNHTFTVNFTTTATGGIYTAENIAVSHNFKAGRSYRMVPLMRPPNVTIVIKDISQ